MLLTKMSIGILKIIALLTMTIDHIGAVILTNEVFLRVVGRISFPLFAFCVGIGLKYTKNLKKYILRLFIFALISLIPFNMHINRGFIFQIKSLSDLFKNNSVIVTFLISAIAAYCYEFIKNNRHKIYYKIYKKNYIENKDTGFEVIIKIFSIVCIFLILNIANYLNTDYGTYGATLAFLIYLLKDKLEWIACIIIFSYILYGLNEYFIMACTSSICVYAYNGKKGFDIKWLFYIYYPLHFIILTYIKTII